MVFTIIILGIIAFALFGYIVKQEIEEEKAKIKTIKTKILFKRGVLILTFLDKTILVKEEALEYSIDKL